MKQQAIVQERFPDKIDVHHTSFYMQQQLELLESSTMLPENKKSIRAFSNFCGSNGISDARIYRYLFSLRRIGELSEKPFKEMNETDISEVIARLKSMKTVKGKPYSIHTMNDFRKAISKFWRWLFYEEYQGDAPKQVKRLIKRESNGKHEPEIYSKEEMKKIIDGQIAMRDKAFFACLYDLQCRVSELLSRQIRHVRFDDEGNMEMLVEADKTKNSHWETLYESAAYLMAWLRQHPASDEPKAPLWTLWRKNGKVEPLNYGAVNRLFYKVCKRQNIRRLKIHTIRKSKATHDLFDGVPVTYIESRGSWSKGSTALQQCYLSVQRKDKDSAYRKKYRMATSGPAQKSTELKQCKRCSSPMETDARFCMRCGLPVDSKAVVEIKDIKQENLELLSELVKKKILEELEKRT